MKLSRIIILTLTLICLLLPVNLLAIKLVFKDNRGHYHYRCTDKTGGITIVVYRAEGVFVDGPEGQEFFPGDTTEMVRSPDYTKITEKYARWGCREKLLR